MTKVKVEKILVISFIGFIITLFVGLGGNIVLKAGLPASVSKTEVNFEKRLDSLEDDFLAGTITKHEHDSLLDELRLQIKRSDALKDENHNPGKIPDWVTNLGISEPEGMKFDEVLSHYTFVNDPTERFNSVSLVFIGDFDNALNQATKLAAKANLTPRRNFIAKGSPAKKNTDKNNQEISFMNYDLGNMDQNFLISLQVEPSGSLTIMVTDKKQLDKCLLAYEPLNNRLNVASKQKKQ